MLRRIRRNNKEPIEESPSAAAEASEDMEIPTDETPTEEAPSSRLNFFDLPAEIRNAIYEFVVSDTTLSLPALFAASKRSKLSLKRRKPIPLPAPINSLLIASRQCRQEYLAVLLSTVSVVVEVEDFDFKHLTRASSSLTELDIQSLQTNRHLTVVLVTQNCTSKDIGRLRRWLEHQKHSKLALPWKYEFPIDKLLPPTTMGHVRLLRELEYYADMISTLIPDMDEGQQRELRTIIEAFQCKASQLEDDLGWLSQRSKSISRTLRGLAGGGVH